MKNKRNVGMDLLRLLAMSMIIFSHSMPVLSSESPNFADYYMDLHLATTSIQRFIISLMKYGGQLGNDIFVVCSAWFLICNDHTSYKKVFRIIGDSFVISVFMLVCTMWGGGTAYLQQTS